ncbi:MAG: extracellular solute-binding protein [Lachnospiraceae bacterium]|nr:extracellular solute-binding protein [Lachnospiraceae bacterium]
MRKSKGVSRILSLMLLFCLLLTAICGCGDTGVNDSSREGKTTDNSDNSGVNGAEAGEYADNVAMGRYLEDVTDLLDAGISGYNNKIFKLADGNLVITDEYVDFIASKDNGITWETDKRDWRTGMIEDETYILDLAVGAEGTTVVIYDAGEGDDDFKPVLKVIKPDGTEIPAEISLTEDDKYPWLVSITEDGRIFTGTLGGNIYEVKEDGSSEKFLTLDRNAQLIQFVGSKMIIDGYYYDSLLIYDMEKKEYIEDEVLNDFVNENYGNRSFNGNSWFDLYFFPDNEEEDVIYLAGEKGLHRHVIGGSVMEQVIDGSLCTFNNPAYGLLSMTALENNEFLALFNQGRLVRFTYHPEVPTVPTESVKAYSLKDNSILRRAISLYQEANPEVYVEYEIGMEEGSSITREDALKKLNTEIMAGNGPDLLILDDMPVDSYIEKGLLLDLSSYIDGLSGEAQLLPNIVEAFRTDDGIYTIPCEFELPAILGKEKYVSQMSGLEGIAEAMEELRKDNQEKNLLRVCSEKGIMKLFSMACVPAWKTEEGELNREAVAEFLTCCKRIYDAQMDGLSEEAIESYENLNQFYMADYGVTYEDSDYFRSGIDEMNYMMEGAGLAVGTLSYAYAYSEVTSVPRVKGFEDNEIILMNGQTEHVFWADSLAGINAASKNVSRAKELLSVLLGKENGVLGGNFSVNKAAFEENLLPDMNFYISEDEPYSYLTIGNSEGIEVTLEVYWMNAQQTEVLRQWVNAANIPYVPDSMLEEAVYGEGAKYMQGERSLEEAISNIEKKVSLYMAE